MFLSALKTDSRRSRHPTFEIFNVSNNAWEGFTVRGMLIMLCPLYLSEGDLHHFEHYGRIHTGISIPSATCMFRRFFENTSSTLREDKYYYTWDFIIKP